MRLTTTTMCRCPTRPHPRCTRTYCRASRSRPLQLPPDPHAPQYHPALPRSAPRSAPVSGEGGSVSRLRHFFAVKLQHVVTKRVKPMGFTRGSTASARLASAPSTLQPCTSCRSRRSLPPAWRQASHHVTDLSTARRVGAPLTQGSTHTRLRRTRHHRHHHNHRRTAASATADHTTHGHRDPRRPGGASEVHPARAIQRR